MMRRTLPAVVTATCFAILAQAFAYAAPAKNQEREKDLAAKIAQEQNPGKKARLQLRLARLKLADADVAYHERDFAGGRTFLEQYLEQVRNSWATLENTEDGAGKHLGALKDLEISLREDGRILEDLRRRVPYPESEAIKDIATESGEVHNRVIEALFPSGYPQKGKRKHQEAPKSSNPVSTSGLKS